MYSSRKYSVKRHIENLHNGLGNIISFIDYIAGRRQGVYFQTQFLATWWNKARLALRPHNQWMLLNMKFSGQFYESD